MQLRNGKASSVAQVDQSLQITQSADRLLRGQEEVPARITTPVARATPGFAAAVTVGAVAMNAKRSRHRMLMHAHTTRY